MRGPARAGSRAALTAARHRGTHSGAGRRRSSSRLSAVTVLIVALIAFGLARVASYPSGGRRWSGVRAAGRAEVRRLTAAPEVPRRAGRLPVAGGRAQAAVPEAAQADLRGPQAARDVAQAVPGAALAVRGVARRNVARRNVLRAARPAAAPAPGSQAAAPLAGAAARPRARRAARRAVPGRRQAGQRARPGQRARAGQKVRAGRQVSDGLAPASRPGRAGDQAQRNAGPCAPAPGLAAGRDRRPVTRVALLARVRDRRAQAAEAAPRLAAILPVAGADGPGKRARLQAPRAPARAVTADRGPLARCTSIRLRARQRELARSGRAAQADPATAGLTWAGLPAQPAAVTPEATAAAGCAADCNGVPPAHRPMPAAARLRRAAGHGRNGLGDQAATHRKRSRAECQSAAPAPARVRARALAARAGAGKTAPGAALPGALRAPGQAAGHACQRPVPVLGGRERNLPGLPRRDHLRPTACE